MNETVKLAVELIKNVYAQEGGGAGGGAHIVTDDGNLEDNNIQWCLDQPEVTVIEQVCLRYLLSMSYQDREAAYHMFWEDDGQKEEQT